VAVWCVHVRFAPWVDGKVCCTMTKMAGPWRSRETATPNAIVGAARRIHIDDRDEVERMRERGVQIEQNLAWKYYDKIGEIKTAYNYFAAISSRVRLYVGYQQDVGEAPMPIGEIGNLSRSFVTAARYELNKLSKGKGGQPNLLRAFVLNLLVPGECYLVGDKDTWAIRSTSELVFEADGRIRVKASRTEAKKYEYLSPNAFVARIWRTHPQYSDDADSALMGLLEDCSELLLTARLIRASGKSRLNAGLLYVADELRFQRAADPASPDAPQPDIDPFEEELTLALTEPVGETDSPSEVMPLLVRGPAEFIDTGIKKFDLSRQITEVDIKRFEQLVKRILTNLDLPSDLVTGMANVRYSNARTISEDLLKAYVEPMILIICEALTTVFLRPQLIARGYDPEYVKNVHVWYDPSEVVTRPDRSDDADKGYEKILVSGRTWRRAHGFTELDAPEPDEVMKRIALENGVPQSLAIDFLRILNPKLMSRVEELAAESFADQSKQTANGALTPGAGGAGGTGVPPGPVPGPQQAPPTADNPPATEPPEGGLEGGVNGRPKALSVQSERIDQERFLEMMQAITAAANPQVSEIVEDRTRRLERALEVERRLRESMFVHLNDVVQRSLERAGARTVSKTVRKDQALRTVLSDIPIEEAYANIPEERLAEFGLSDARELIKDSIEKAKERYFELVGRAQDQGWRALGGDVYDAQHETQQDNLEKSWEWLSKKLTTLATGFLRHPKRGGVYVSMDVVRDAATLAGGGKHEAGPSDPAISRSNPPDSGRAILSAATLESTGWELSERYRWVYGVSENQFEPHVRLDGTVFDSWGAKTLASATPDEWPYITHYYPGDHNGCRCDWLPEVLDPAAVNAPVRGDTSRVAIAASAAESST
jgi:hypothetical protein